MAHTCVTFLNAHTTTHLSTMHTLDTLPMEMVLAIAHNLTLRDALTLRAVCTKFAAMLPLVDILRNSDVRAVADLIKRCQSTYDYEYSGQCAQQSARMLLLWKAVQKMPTARALRCIALAGKLRDPNYWILGIRVTRPDFVAAIPDIICNEDLLYALLDIVSREPPCGKAHIDEQVNNFWVYNHAQWTRMALMNNVVPPDITMGEHLQNEQLHLILTLAKRKHAEALAWALKYTNCLACALPLLTGESRMPSMQCLIGVMHKLQLTLLPNELTNMHDDVANDMLTAAWASRRPDFMVYLLQHVGVPAPAHPVAHYLLEALLQNMFVMLEALAHISQITELAYFVDYASEHTLTKKQSVALLQIKHMLCAAIMAK